MEFKEQFKNIQNTFYLRTFGFFKIPLLFFLSPTVVELSENRCEIKIPLTYRSKNHLGGMYFGALSAGADCAGGMIAMQAIEASGKKISLVFKDFHAEFLKRAEGDTHFICEEGHLIRELVKKALESTDRVEMPVHIVATTPKKSGAEPVAKFVLTLSLKKRSMKEKNENA